MKIVMSMALVVGLQAICTSALAQNVLRLGITTNGNAIEIRALDRRSVKPNVQPIESVTRLHSVFFSIECYVNSDCSQLQGPDEAEPALIETEDLVPTLKAEGDRLLGPFAKLIRAADEVRFQIDWSLIKVPFDLLHLEDEPIFVRKKISFSFGDQGTRAVRTASESWVGLLVSDETADPDRAIFGIGKQFPRSKSFDIADFGLSTLRDMQPVDFVAISAHGHVNGSGDGFIALGNRERLASDSLVNLRPKLVYFDSCNLGISATHLKELQRTGTRFAIAPILSNEAGDSSTATIEVFFSELVKGVDPSTAMFKARSQLYATYTHSDLRVRLWRAFPFRVYLLN